eukprot:6474365-Alexandrium_andersonii.AAC.1
MLAAIDGSLGRQKPSYGFPKRAASMQQRVTEFVALLAVCVGMHTANGQGWGHKQARGSDRTGGINGDMDAAGVH